MNLQNIATVIEVGRLLYAVWFVYMYKTELIAPYPTPDTHSFIPFVGAINVWQHYNLTIKSSKSILEVSISTLIQF